jgi:MSHA biogenesis protein MshJ
MKQLAPMLENLALRFSKLSVRERVLVLGAAIAAVLVLWNLTLMGPLDAKRNSLQQELFVLQDGMSATADAAEAAEASDPVSIAFMKQQALQGELRQVNGELAKESSGLIEPKRMAEVIHAVLSRQHGVTLLSMKNLPPQSLAKDKSQGSGPYIHPVELVVEGNYLDVLTYLHALEALPYRFYWRVLELKTTEYPVNRVRIELGTLSMDREWIGI